MLVIIWLGGLLLIAGVLHLAGHAIWHGDMSGLTPSRPAAPGPTAEQTRHGAGFFIFRSNWPGIVMMAVGAILLLSVALF